MWMCMNRDTNQYGKALASGLYEYAFITQCEMPDNTYCIYSDVIDLNDYTFAECMEYLKPYGTSIYNIDDPIFMAECIFETHMFTDADELAFGLTKDEADEFIKNFISGD